MKIYYTNHLLRAFPKILGGNLSVMSHFSYGYWFPVSCVAVDRSARIRQK